VQFTPKDYPNFFKVNHYKKNKTAEKEFDKDSIKNEKIRRQSSQSISIPKHEVDYMDSHQVHSPPKHHSRRNNHSLEPAKTNSTQSLETGITGSPHHASHTDHKNKNKKNLSINIPDKNKYLESQMNALKTTNSFNPATPQNTNNYRRESKNSKHQQQQQDSPQAEQDMRMTSPPIKVLSPTLTKSANKASVLTSKKQETPSIFNFNEYSFNQPEQYANNNALKTPDLPSYLDGPMIHSMNQHLAQVMPHHMSQQFPSPMYPMNPQYGQFTPQQLNAHASMMAQMNMMNNHMNPPMTTAMNPPTTANTPVPNHNYYKIGGVMDPLDSPYTKFNFNNRFFYPFGPFSAAPEEGFSPFLKNNMALDISNPNNLNSSKLKKDKNAFFTFKGDNSNMSTMKSEHLSTPYNNEHAMMQESNHKADYNHESTSFMEKPKKKLKV